MRNKFQKVGLLSISILLCSCAATTSYINAPVEVKLVDGYAGEFEYGKPIDTEWFFYCSDRNNANTCCRASRCSKRQLSRDKKSINRFVKWNTN